MNPSISKVAFTVGLTFLFLALFSLAFINANSPEFIIDVISVIILTVFLIIVVWDTRRELSSYKVG